MARWQAQMGSDTFRIPNEVRPHLRLRLSEGAQPYPRQSEEAVRRGRDR